MRVLQIHNEYRYRTGEHAVVAAERAGLQRAGCEVVVYTRDNREIDGYSAAAKLRMVLTAFANPETAASIRRIIADRRPVVAHVHNVFPLVSPVVYRVLHRARVPIVQSVHNYRLVCPCGILYRNGRECDAAFGCFGAAIRARCYRRSRLQTAWYALILLLHRCLRTFESIDLFLAPSTFVRDKLVRFGFPAERIRVKPHFLPAGDFVQATASSPKEPPYALYAGQLEPHKGVRTLLAAAHLLRSGGESIADDPFRLKVAGAGSLDRLCRGATADGVEYLGVLPFGDVRREMAGCRMLVFPSECPEVFGMTILEAFACGKAVVGSDAGAIPELLGHGAGGEMFRAGDPQALARAIRSVWSDDRRRAAMGARNRAEFDARYTEASGIRDLLAIYEDVAMGRRT